MSDIVVRRKVSVEDRARSTYLEVGFAVEGAVDSLEIRLDYDRTAGVVDLGCRGPAGFRGWSGGARARVVVSGARSTPGYLTGAPEQGEWAVVLGLHRVPAAGLDLTVRVSVPATEPATPDPPPPAPLPVSGGRARRTLPAAPGLRWLAGDLHAHTLHSDGTLSVAQLAALAAAEGLDFLAVTDHNTVSHHSELPGATSRYGVALLPGQEVTTDRGHANAFGDVGWVDFRAAPATWVEHVRAAGGLLSVNHPLAGDLGWQHALRDRPPLAEVWHWTWLGRRWTAPLAWWAAWGYDTVPVGGSDFHRPEDGRRLGRPVTWVACDVDLVRSAARGQAVMDGLRASRTAISASRDAPVLLRVDDELVAVGADGTLLVDVQGRRQVVRGEAARFPAAPGPHHLETPAAEVVALAY